MPQERRAPRLGPALRNAWVGYRRLLDDELAAEGFGDHGFPDGRVLRICAGPDDVTISQIGRELGVSRQAASKIVAGLEARRYVRLLPSRTDSREKAVKLTQRAVDFLGAQRKAARRIERRLRAEVGADAFEHLYRLLEALGGEEQPRLRDYLRARTLLRNWGSED